MESSPPSPAAPVTQTPDATTRGWAMLIAANVVFAGAYVSGKFALTAVSPVTLNALRFTSAGLLLVPVVIRLRREARMDRRDLVTFVAISLLSFVLNKLFEYEGLNLSTASDGALLISGESIFTALLAWSVLRERATWVRGVALTLGFAGAYLIVERGFAPHFLTGAGRIDLRVLGDALFVLSLTFEAVASIISKRLAGRFSPLFVSAATIVGSVVVWAPAGVVDIGAHGLRLTPLAVGGIADQALFVTIVGYFLWFGGLQLIDGSAAATTLFLQPLIGTLLAVVILGDRINLFTVLGGACIVISVLAVSRGARSPSGGAEIAGVLPPDAP